MDQLNKNTAKPPHIDSRDILILLDVSKHIFFMGFFVLVKNIIKQLGTHVLRSGQLILLQVLKDKARAIINKLKLILW